MTDISMASPDPINPNIYMSVTTGIHTIFSVLYISTDNEELRNKYIEVGTQHNDQLSQNKYPDSGFDLYVPDDVIFDTHFGTKFIDMQVKTKMVYFNSNIFPSITSGFCMYPRSSMANTELMLANHTGVIDSGYRGNLIGAFRWLPVGDATSYTVVKNTRLVQVCHPSLCPVFVIVANNIDDETIRDTNGFGSTGL
jgi:dUTPase